MTNESLLNKQFVSINDTSLHTDKPQGFTGYVMILIMPSDILGLFWWGETTTRTGVFPTCFSCSDSTQRRHEPDCQQFASSYHVGSPPVLAAKLAKQPERVPTPDHNQPSCSNWCYHNAGRYIRFWGSYSGIPSPAVHITLGADFLLLLSPPT